MALTGQITQAISRSEGFARAAYFVPGRDGMGVWPNSEIVPSAPPASSFTKID